MHDSIFLAGKSASVKSGRNKKQIGNRYGRIWKIVYAKCFMYIFTFYLNTGDNKTPIRNPYYHKFSSNRIFNQGEWDE